MKISTRVRYGLRLLIGLAHNYEKGYSQLGEIAKAENISEKYSEQIVRLLKLKGLLISQRGAKGGYILSLPPEKITVLMILEAMEGELNIIDCLKNSKCNKTSSCVARDVWKKLNEKMKETLSSITLKELAESSKIHWEKITYEI